MEKPGNASLAIKFFLAVCLCVAVIFLYHKRAWFRNIPEKQQTAVAGGKNVSAAPGQQAKAAAPVQPEAQPPLPAPPPEALTADRSFIEQTTTRLKKTIGGKKAFDLDKQLNALFKAYAASDKKTEKKPRQKPPASGTQQVRLQRGKPLPEYAIMVARLVRDTPYWISDSYESAIDTAITLTIADNTGPIKVIVLAYGKQYVPGFARIAIVLEGFGESMPPELSDLFAMVNCPMNIGIVPGRPYSLKIYQSAMRGGWETICQLPMESVPYVDLGAGGIYKTTTADNLEKLLARFSSEFEGAAGYTMYGGGIRIVENEPSILKTVFKHIKAEDKYFLDNSFASHSRVEELAAAQELKCRVPGLVADRSGTMEQQKERVARFAETARKTGSGIVLLRNGIKSIDLIKYMISYFQKNDIKVVTVSSLFE